MIDRKLLIRLVVPLILVALLGIYFIWPPNVVDLVNNLIVEILGIVITIVFVDWIIRNLEKEKWEEVDVLIRADFASWALMFIAETTFFVENGGITIPKASKAAMSPTKPWSIGLEDVSLEEIHSAILDNDLDERKSYTLSLEKRLENLLSLFTRYSSRLSAKDNKAILELEGVLRALIREMSLIDNEADLLNLAGGDPLQVDAIWEKHGEKAADRLKDVIAQSLQIFGEPFLKRT